MIFMHDESDIYEHDDVYVSNRLRDSIKVKLHEATLPNDMRQVVLVCMRKK